MHEQTLRLLFPSLCQFSSLITKPAAAKSPSLTGPISTECFHPDLLTAIHSFNQTCQLSIKTVNSSLLSTSVSFSIGSAWKSGNYCPLIQPVHSEGDQPWDFFGRNDTKAETSVLWAPHAKSWLIGKDSDAGRDWGQEKGMTEDEMARWHHRLDGHEFGWTPGVGDGQGGLACCNSWGCKESDMTERLNWTELNPISLF